AMDRADARHALEARVAAEQLVAADAGDGDLESRARGGLRDEEDVDAVDRRLIERAHGIRDALAHLLDLDRDGMVLRAVELRGLRGEPALVERGIVEAERHGADRPAVHLGQQSEQRRRVDAAREERAYRDVRDEVMARRVDERLAQPGLGLL